MASKAYTQKAMQAWENNDLFRAQELLRESARV